MDCRGHTLIQIQGINEFINYTCADNCAVIAAYVDFYTKLNAEGSYAL